MKVKVSMMIDIDEKDIEELMRITHHVNEFVDLDAWPEIQSVYDVQVEPMGGGNNKEPKPPYAVILKDGDGNEEVLRENVSDVADVLFRPDYIAVKLWSQEDVRECLQNNGYDGTDEEVAAVIGTGIKGLEDCNDSEWNAIYDAISNAEKAGSIGKHDFYPDLLQRFGFRPVECRDCIHYDGEFRFCGHYGDKCSPHSEDAVGCGHFMSGEGPLLTFSYPYADGSTEELELPFIRERKIEFAPSDLLNFLLKSEEMWKEDADEFLIMIKEQDPNCEMSKLQVRM